MATVSDLSKGNFIRFNGEVMQIEELLHRTPGNLRAFYQIKMRNVRNGKVAENRFRPGDEVQILRVETKEYQYLYNDGDGCLTSTGFWNRQAKNRRARPEPPCRGQWSSGR